jgi:hypothetical protein
MWGIFFDELPFHVRDRLKQFSDPARKCLPLNHRETELWNDFVVKAFRAKTVIDEEPFIDWFVAGGWSREDARELAARFYDECQLLSTFLEEVLAR